MALQMAIANMMLKLRNNNKINTKLNNKLALTPEQVKENKIRKLREDMIHAKNRMVNSPDEYNRAQRAYYISNA